MGRRNVFCGLWRACLSSPSVHFSLKSPFLCVRGFGVFIRHAQCFRRGLWKRLLALGLSFGFLPRGQGFSCQEKVLFPPKQKRDKAPCLPTIYAKGYPAPVCGGKKGHPQGVSGEIASPFAAFIRGKKLILVGWEAASKHLKGSRRGGQALAGGTGLEEGSIRLHDIVVFGVVYLVWSAAATP